MPDDTGEEVYSLGDPDPLEITASQADKREWNNNVNEYAQEVLQVIEKYNTKGEELWIEFTQTFRSSSIMAFSTKNLIEWISLLTSRGVYVEKKRGLPRIRALNQCLTQERFVPCTIETTESENLNSGRGQESGTVHQSHHENNSNTADAIVTSSALDPETSNILNPSRNQNQPVPHISSDNNQMTQPRSAGVLGLMRAYQGRTKFSGAFDEDLNSCIELFDTNSTMCALHDNEKVQGFPVMLRDDALNFYLQSKKPDDTYATLVQRFRDQYVTAEQRNRVLISWQGTRLSALMNENTAKSELQVFRSMCTYLSKLQRQLSSIYRNDEFLRDQIVISSDTAKIQQSMRERVPLTSGDATNRIATFLSSQPGSAAAFSAIDDALYNTGNKYGGEAERTLKRYRKNSKSVSRWLAEQKGCFVCKKNHRARDHHSRAQVSEAIEKLKKQYPKALVSIEDFAMVVENLSMMTENEEDEKESESSDSDGSDIEIDIANLSEECIEVLKAEEIALANNSFVHGRTFKEDHIRNIEKMYDEIYMGEETKFKGIYIDTCANRSSIMSLSQYKAYCSEFHVPMNISKDNMKTIRGVGGKSASVGTTTIPIPFRKLNLIVDVRFQLMRDNVPTLLSMKDMIQSGLDISIQRHEIMYKKRRQSLKLENYFLIHRWKPRDISYSMYTEEELRKLHRTFGHPTASAFKKVLKAARPEEMTPEVREWIREITDSCKSCAKYSSKPRRFKLTVGTEDLRFNHIVAVDIMYIMKKPVLHMVDEATHFSAACFLSKVSTEKVWKAFLKLWTRTYLGPPDHLRIDQGSQFVSKEFLSCSEAEGISILQAPIESPTTMSHVERYHAPLRVAFLKIRDSLPRSETDVECLEMAVKSVNDTIGPEGLCPTLLVFGSIPRPARNLPAETQLNRSMAIEKAMKDIRKEQAKRRVAFGLRTNGISIGKESSSDLRNLPSGSDVLVYRNKSKKWEGPFKFIEIDGETCTIQLPSGRKIFRSNVVKPVKKSIFGKESEKEELLGKDSQDQEIPIQDEIIEVLFTEEGEDTISDAYPTVVMKPNEHHDFLESRSKELSGLMGKGIFKIVDRKSVPSGSRIFGTRWVDALKTVDGKTFEKSRLVAQNYRDKGATSISTKSPTITRLGFRTAVTLCSILPDVEPYLRDISQAYTQSDSNLDRSIYLNPVEDMKLPKDKVLLAVKPLYGIPESGLHWFVSYSSHHKNTLQMTPTKFDPCFFYRRNEKEFEGATVLQVDDSFGFGTKQFLKDESSTGKKFLSKERELLKEGSEHDFNGFVIKRLKEKEFLLQQYSKLKDLSTVKNQAQFISERAKIQYIGICTRPDVCAASQLLASSAENPEKEDYKKLNLLVKRCQDTSDVGLKFIPLDTKTLRLMLFSDASFANTKDLKSQLGFILLLADKNGQANILHYGSSRCRRVTRSVMAAEIHGLVYGFDYSYVVQSILTEVLNHTIPIDAYVDSKTLFNVIAKSSPTLEKRLQIDVFSLKESHAKKELSTLSWIPGDQNIADGLTKGIVKDSHPLWKLLTTNTITVQPTGWVQQIKGGTSDAQ